MCQFLINISILTSLLLAVIWTYFTLKQGGRSFYLKSETHNGTSSKRIDWKLIEDVTFQLIAFISFIFLIANYIIFTITDRWVYGQEIGKGTLVTIIVTLIVALLRHFYDSIKDASEKRYKIQEINKNKEID